MQLKKNLPNWLTWMRIALIPLFTVLFFIPNHAPNAHWMDWLAASIFILAAMTDWLDGFLARLWQQTSDFGAFLDPVADKLMVSVALILLVHLERTWPIWAMIIIGREITISALREWMAQMGKRHHIAVAKIGKFKTAVQMAAIITLLIYEVPSQNWHFHKLGNILMVIASVLTVWSMLVYLKIAIAESKISHQEHIS